jgi:GNAT superfamily N-acetyltransferase
MGSMVQTISLSLDGYTDLQAGKIANVVTFLEMRERPECKVRPDPSLSLIRLVGGDAARYFAIYRTVGDRWLWFSRVRDGAALPALLDHPQLEALVLRQRGSDIGLLELDRRSQGEVEIAFFGLVETEIGRGIGRWLMNEAIGRAFAQPIARLFVHTCTFDHPRALNFYRSAGFKPYKIAIEVLDDPRLTGLLPSHSAPHIPIIR